MSAKVTGSPFGDCSRLPLGLEAGEGGGGQFGQYALGFRVIPASLASGVLTSAPCLYSPVSEFRTHTLHMRRHGIPLGPHLLQLRHRARSEERRVGKECRSWWWR